MLDVRTTSDSRQRLMLTPNQVLPCKPVGDIGHGPFLLVRQLRAFAVAELVAHNLVWLLHLVKVNILVALADRARTCE